MQDTHRNSLFPRLPAGQTRALRVRLQRLIRDATQIDAPPEASQPDTEPFWELDPTPLVIESAEWQTLSAALVQRARLYNAFLRDIYSEQSVLKTRQLPPEIVLGDPQYRRPCLQLEPDRANPATLLRFDLVKTPEGWVFTGVHANTPIGISYAVQNRRFLIQEAGQIYGVLPDYHSIINYPLDVLEALRQLSPRAPAEASIVVLTAGPQDPFYAEHSFLARKMGVPLARGDDLLVLDNCVYFKTIAGLERVDVIYRRLDDAHIDPVVFSTPRQGAGVPGLIQCVRHRNVVVANAIGTGIAESRALDAFALTLCRYYLGENPLLPSLSTYLCHDEEAVEAVLARSGQLRLRAAQPRSEAALRLPPTGLTLRPGDTLPNFARSAPHDYVLQAPARAAPAGGFSSPSESTGAASTLSAFVLAQGSRYRVLPGGLVHIDGAEPSPHRLGVTADVLVLQARFATEPESSPSTPHPAAPRTPLGSRSAEHLYWLGRYAERAEATASMLSIFDDVALEEIPASERRKWLPVWQGLLEATGHAGEKLSPRTNFQNVLSLELAWRMSLDRDHPSSIYSSVEMARENARQLRDCISPEAWVVLNQLYGKLQLLLHSSAAEVPSDTQGRTELSRTAVQQVVAGMNAFLGTAERTLLQDASWHFLRVGLHLERAMMTCSALRHILTALEHEAASVPSVAERDNPELSALVRMLGSQDAYRRLYQAPSLPPLVAELFLRQEAAPRSVRHNLLRIRESLAAVHREIADGLLIEGERVPDDISALLEFVQRLAFATPVETVEKAHDRKAPTLGNQLSQLLQQLYQLHTRVSDHYFSHQARFPSAKASAHV